MTARPVQASFFDGMERPVGPLPMSVMTGTNADLVARIAPLYLTGSVLDTTYGRGKWWDRFRPEPFVFHDLAVDGVDFTALPHDDGSFDTVVFDPPYIRAGGLATSTVKDFRHGFGLIERTQAELWELVEQGLTESARVAARWLLVKCSDFAEGSGLVLGHVKVIGMADAIGLKVHDLIVHHAGSGPGGHNIYTVKRARRAHSYLLVFDASRAVVRHAGEAVA